MTAKASAVSKTRVVALGSAQLPRARRLAEQLGLDLEPLARSDWQCAGDEGECLLVGPDGLALARADRPRVRPLRVDLLAGAQRRRLYRAGLRSEALARAAGLAADRPVDIVDTTAGLGRDALLLAWLGCRVLMFERDPLLAALLADAMRRAAADPDPRARAALGRMRLVVADAATLLAELCRRLGSDAVVYLDPMFTDGRGSAAAGREIAYLQSREARDDDGTALLEAALASPCRRVVVKRPVRAACLGGHPVTHQLPGRSVRFDVYVPGMRSLEG